MIARRHRRRRGCGRRSRRFSKTRYGVNEILSSLMLVYVALQLLNYLVTGPWKDPNGQNFPQTAPFTPWQMTAATICSGTPFPPGLFIAFALALVFWIVMARSEFGLGDPRRRRGAEGGALRRLSAPTDDGVAHAADLGRAWRASPACWRRRRQSRPAQSRLSLRLRLHRDHRLVPRPAASDRRRLIAGVVLAVTYVGGQVAQTAVHVPSSTAGIFQAMMLFLILASDVLVRRRIRIDRAPEPATAAQVAGARHEPRFPHRGDRHDRQRDDADPARRDRRTRRREERRAQSRRRGHDAGRRDRRLRRHLHRGDPDSPIDALARAARALARRVAAGSRARSPRCCSASSC